MSKKESISHVVSRSVSPIKSRSSEVHLEKISATEEEIVLAQLESVTDTTCMYSEKYPERDKPPTESFVGGLGTDCI